MRRQRIALVTYVNLDPVPGAFHTEESALSNLRGILNNFGLGGYNPEVAYPPESVQSSEDHGRRRAFVVYIDLDSVPGTMYSQESAQNAVRNVLREAIGHYDPLVSLAPADIQPNKSEGTN